MLGVRPVKVVPAAIEPVATVRLSTNVVPSLAYIYATYEDEFATAVSEMVTESADFARIVGAAGVDNGLKLERTALFAAETCGPVKALEYKSN